LLGKGVQKYHGNAFAISPNPFFSSKKKSTKKINVCSSSVFCFIEVLLFFSDGDGSLNTLQQTFYKEIVSTKTPMSIPPRFLVLSRFWCFSAMGVQTHHNKLLAKKSCRICFTQKTTKNTKPFFPLHLLNRVSRRFLGEGGLETPPKGDQKRRSYFDLRPYPHILTL
jgi:hypothetical protein